LSSRPRRLIATLALAAAGTSAVASTLSPDGVPRPGTVARATATPIKKPRFTPTNARPAAARGRWLIARVVRPVLLRSRPNGPRVARLGTRTEFGSPRILSVVRRRGGWLGVSAPQIANGRVGWVRARRVRLGRVDHTVVVRLSRRELVLRSGTRTRRISIGIGASTSPTPLGRFAVTDLLRIRRGTPYGCCALALSGRQPRLPANWAGGDRLAIHGTIDEGTVGAAKSYGCLHARAADLRRLLRSVPLGTPVFVRA